MADKEYSIPDDLRYSTEHEWARLGPGGLVTVGITDFAQDQLGPVIYVDLPEVGKMVEQFKGLGEVESIKTVSGFYAPVAGEVVEVNGELAGHTEYVNAEPYNRGWMARIRPSDLAQMDKLLTPPGYRSLIANLHH